MSCGAADVCPENLVCLSDGKCHASDAEELCVPGDQDGSVADGSVDGVDGGDPPDASGIDAAVIDAADPDVDAGPPVSPTQAGDLVISEIHKNPAVVADMVGEWFEVLNPTRSTFNLLGLQVQDLGAESFTIDESVIVPPRGRVVLARSADMGLNGGVAVDFDYSLLGFSLANGVDEIQILTGDQQTIIDTVAYDQTFPSAQGRAMSLDPEQENETANNEATSWCDAQSVFGDGDFGTPGRANDPCP